MTTRVEDDTAQDGTPADPDPAVIAAARVWQLISARLPGEECIP